MFVYRPYSKLVSLTVNGTYDIDLTDSAGSAIDCTYLRAHCLDANSQADFVHIEPLGLASGVVQFSATSSTASYSGALGTVCGGDQDCEIIVSESDKFNKIRVRLHNVASGFRMAITYGVLQEPNMLRSRLRNTGF